MMVGARGTSNAPVEGVALMLPFPRNVSSASLTANVGSVLFNAATKCCSWRVGKPLGSEQSLGSAAPWAGYRRPRRRHEVEFPALRVRQPPPHRL